jgi:hypothetical protein
MELYNYQHRHKNKGEELIMLKKLIGLFLILVLIVGCSSNNGVNQNNDMDGAYAESPAENQSSKNFGANVTYEDDMDSEAEYTIEFNESLDIADNVVVATSRKIIKSGYVVMETLNYENAIESLQETVKAYNGYIENSNIGGKRIHQVKQSRHAYFTIRIPEASYTDFVEDVNTIGYVVTQQTNAQDITSNYFDTDARVRTLEVQEERLLDILKKAEKIEDVIVLEKELSSVRYEIERLTQTLRRWDQQVSYSTFEVTIEEVYEIVEEKEVPISLSDKIKAGFENTLENISEFFEGLTINTVSFVPYLIFIVPGLLILWWIIKRIKRGYHGHSESTVITSDSEEENK